MGGMGCLGGEIKDSKKKLKSEIWGKGVCDIWEKWVCLGGEIRLQNKELNTFSKHASGSILATEISVSTFGEMGVGRVGGGSCR